MMSDFGKEVEDYDLLAELLGLSIPAQAWGTFHVARAAERQESGQDLETFTVTLVRPDGEPIRHEVPRLDVLHVELDVLGNVVSRHFQEQVHAPGGGTP